MDLTVEEAREFVANASMWPRVRDFLWDFAPQVHESWIGGIPFCANGAGDGAARAPSLESPRVRRYILLSLGVEPLFHRFPEDDWSRLLLIDGTVLLEIAKWLGALVCAKELRKVTDGNTVRELKSVLRGIYPDVFGYTMYFGGMPAMKARNADEVVAAGTGALLRFLSPLDPGLLRRLQLKLPKRHVDNCAAAGGETVSAKDFAKLLKLKFPEAYSLCC